MYVCIGLDLLPLSFHTDIRGEKTRKQYVDQLKRHRAAVCIQRQVKGRIGRKRFEALCEASTQIQSGTILNLCVK